jgi:GcrA cell cycle regulator
MSWTEARIDRLTKLWGDGLSCGQIARDLGGITRNAVIGKIHRLGLAGRAEPAKPQRLAHVPRAPKPASVRIVGHATFIQHEGPLPRTAFNARAFEPLPGTESVPFGARGCRWPVEGHGAEMRQCGCEREGAGPYCGTHQRASAAPLKPGSPRTGNELARSLRRYLTGGSVAA